MTSEIDKEEYEKTPWMFKEFRKLDVSGKFKILIIVGGVCLYFYLFYQWFGGYFLFGFIPAPIWFLWAMRQIDQEAITLIEFRIKGDEKDEEIISRDTQTNIYKIPPDIWKKVKVRGTPYNIGSKMYVCDNFTENDEGEWTVVFPDDPQLANMNFYTRIKLWLELKKKIPEMIEQIAVYRHNIDILSMERAITIMEKTHGISKAITEQEFGVIRRSPIKIKKGGNANVRQDSRIGEEPGRGD